MSLVTQISHWFTKELGDPVSFLVKIVVIPMIIAYIILVGVMFLTYAIWMLALYVMFRVTG